MPLNCSMSMHHVRTYHGESSLVGDDVSVSLLGLGRQFLPLWLQFSTPLLLLLRHWQLVHGQCAIALLDVPGWGEKRRGKI